MSTCQRESSRRFGKTLADWEDLFAPEFLPGWFAKSPFSRHEHSPPLLGSRSGASICSGSGTHPMIGKTITHNKTLEGATENESRRIAVENEESCIGSARQAWLLGGGSETAWRAVLIQRFEPSRGAGL